MGEIINHAVAHPRRASTASTTSRDQIATDLAGAQLSVAAVWCDAATTFSQHTFAILLLACVGLAGATVIGLAISTVLQLDKYVYASGPFATYVGLRTLASLDDRGVLVTLILQGGLGLLLGSFARGAITHLALNSNGLGAACRAAWMQFPALLVGSVIYSGLIGFGAVGVNVWLRDAHSATRLDLSNAGQGSVTVEGALQVTLVRALNALIPDPGALVAEFVPYWRHTAFAHLEHVANYNQERELEYISAIHGGVAAFHMADDSARSDESLRVVVISVLILLIGETLLCFRTVAVMHSGSHGIVLPMLRSVWWCMRNPLTVTFHTWLVRLAIFLFSLLFIIFPIALVQCFADPAPAWIDAPVDIVNLPVIMLTLAFSNSLFAAFGAVYVARLYLALRGGRIHGDAADEIDIGRHERQPTG